MKNTNEVLPPPSRIGLAGLGLLLATGCAVGPTFRTQDLPKPPETAQYGATPLPAATAAAPAPLGGAQSFVPGPVAERWWTGFGSAELDGRVDQALQHSPTLAAARAALLRAQENVRAANGGRFPSVALQAGVTRQNSIPAGAVTTPYNVLNASVNVSYTLDLFGAVRRGVEFQQALAGQQQWLEQGARTALAANVATASIQEAGLRAQLRASEAIVGLYREQEAITRKQVELGAKSSVDLLAAQANLAAARVPLPGMARQLEALRNQLQVYLGRFPSEAGLGSLELEALTLPGELPVTLPSELVRQRPDVRAAEAQLQAATAQLGLASASLYPSLTLGGSLGTQALRGGDFPASAFTVWDVGLNLLQPILNGGSLRAQKRAAAAGLDQAVAGYRAVVLGAFADVADTLDALQRDAETLQASAEAEAAARRSLDLAQDQYRLGAAGYPMLLDATRLWHGARIGLIHAQAARLADTAALYAALGGGWTSPQP